MLSRFVKKGTCLNRICFSGGATFLLRGTVNGHSCHARSKLTPHEVAQQWRESPEININIFGPLFLGGNLP
jgi:hypothetical protein